MNNTTERDYAFGYTPYGDWYCVYLGLGATEFKNARNDKELRVVHSDPYNVTTWVIDNWKLMKAQIDLLDATAKQEDEANNPDAYLGFFDEAVEEDKHHIIQTLSGIPDAESAVILLENFRINYASLIDFVVAMKKSIEAGDTKNLRSAK